MQMSSPSDLKFEIGHVLFMDIVGYSKLVIDKQTELTRKLNGIVRDVPQFDAAEAEGSLVRLPTGDGIALVFRSNPEAAAQCALEISKALRAHPEIKIRMGIHSGPVNETADVNDRANIAGAGINIAQRVMDCGDADHILLSKRVADDLENYARWQSRLHDLGEAEVKHGVRVHLVNLFGDGFGNPALPSKLRELERRSRSIAKQTWLIAGLIVFAALAGVFCWLRFHSTAKSQSSLAPEVLEKSIAVLPFENLSANADNAYFADGIQDEIITRLSKIGDLKVISRTSTRHYKSSPENLPEIARQLGVAHILEGSVQKAVDRVRINVQLIKASTDAHLWADIYDRNMTDIFLVESEVAQAIAEALQAKLTGREQQILAVKPTNNLEAYDAYLRGLAFEPRVFSSTNDILEKVTAFYERAVELDPTFALAWARLSRADSRMYFGFSSTPAHRDAAERALKIAQKLEPDTAETLLAQAYYQYRVLRDYELARATFRRVERILPGSSEIPRGLAAITLRQGAGMRQLLMESGPLRSIHATLNR